MKAVFWIIVGLIGLGLLTSHLGSSNSRKDANSPPSSSQALKVPDFTVVRRRSWVLDEGVTDAWTGDGKLRFNVKAHNNTSERKTFEFQPIRRYDDGETNESAMDMSSCEIPAHSYLTCWGDFDYEAHKHSLASAAIEYDGKTYALKIVS